MNQSTERSGKKNRFSLSLMLVCKVPETENVPSGHVWSSQLPQLHAIMGSQPKTEVLGNLKTEKVKIFPFNTIMPQINFNDSLRMILWPS